jgi:hypothetical protein
MQILHRLHAIIKLMASAFLFVFDISSRHQKPTFSVQQIPYTAPSPGQLQFRILPAMVGIDKHQMRRKLLTLAPLLNTTIEDRNRDFVV